jgi:organic hydroperoxide reductase OsmC/OhrA
MRTGPDGAGEFTQATLHPHVTITDAARAADAIRLHAEAHRLCFIARSVNFPVLHEPVVAGS